MLKNHQSVPSFQMDRIGVAYSGGPDSMALLALAAREFGPQSVVAIFVEHVIEGVTESLATVEANCASLGVKLIPLKIDWSQQQHEGDATAAAAEVKPKQSKMQEELRNRRYQLIEEACRQANINLCLMGHTIDDDLATMVYRLSHSSGVDGLAGMRALQPSPKSSFCYIGRPLLDFSKQRLLSTLACLTPLLSINEDQSNFDMNYTRNQVRTGIEAMEVRDPNIKEDLIDALAFFKTVRRDNFFMLKEAWDSSSVLDCSTGSLTLTLRDGASSDWLFKRGIGMRFLNLIGQIGSCKSYPASTKSTYTMWHNLVKEFRHYREEQHDRGRRVNRFSTIPALDPLPIDRTRRVKMSSNTCSGSLFYPLSSADSLGRLRQQASVMMQRKTLNVSSPLQLLGPSFLVQRQSPHAFNKFIGSKVKASPIVLGEGEVFTWDNRFNLCFTSTKGASASANTVANADATLNNTMMDAEKNNNPKNKKKLIFEYCTVNDIKEFYSKFSLFPKDYLPFGPLNFSGPRRVKDCIGPSMLRFLNGTPGQLLYTIPVVRDLNDPGYLAFPTLGLQYPPETGHQWSSEFIGTSILKGKILCQA